jgi:hypothetical protein
MLPALGKKMAENPDVNPLNEDVPSDLGNDWRFCPLVAHCTFTFHLSYWFPRLEKIARWYQRDHNSAKPSWIFDWKRSCVLDGFVHFTGGVGAWVI